MSAEKKKENNNDLGLTLKRTGVITAGLISVALLIVMAVLMPPVAFTVIFSLAVGAGIIYGTKKGLDYVNKSNQDKDKKNTESQKNKEPEKEKAKTPEIEQDKTVTSQPSTHEVTNSLVKNNGTQANEPKPIVGQERG